MMVWLARILLVMLFAACARPPAVAEPAGESTARHQFVVLLWRGPMWTGENSPGEAALFEAHAAHLEAMIAAGKMVLAGPLDGTVGGGVGKPASICIYGVDSREEAERLASADPAVVSGHFTIEVLPGTSR